MTMQHAVQRRREVFTEHIASVPSQIMQDLRPSQRTRQWQRSQEEASEIATLTAKLRCTEHNMQDLEKVAEYEHQVARRILTEGRQFYSHVEQQARGFGQEESRAARSNMDIELKRYRQADVVRQQQQLGELQRQLEKASKDALDEHRATLSDRYRTEFVTELRS
eukprot:4757375-Amphidinium_carterae.1